MLLEQNYEINLTPTYSAPRQRLEDLNPIALIFETGDASKRPVAAVFVAPDDARLIHIPVTGANDLAWQKARYIVALDAALKLQPEVGINFQPESKITQLGESAEPQLGTWLSQVATYWSRPQTATRHTPFTCAPA
jgi:hypothetical protein